MFHELFKTLTPDDVILTVNQRLAGYLHTQYAHYQSTLDTAAAWQTPDILPLNSWLLRCWQAGITHNKISPLLLLKPQQEIALWEQIIAKHISQTNQLLSLNATAKMAKQAWQLTQQWQIDYRETLFAEAEDHKIWQCWARDFEKICAQNNWLDNASLPNRLLNAILKQQISLPKRLFLMGFDEINPAFQQLFKAIETTECAVITHLACQNAKTQQASTIAMANLETEIYTMAHWAAKHHNAQRIACIVPNLNEIRSQINAIFTEVLAPQTLLPNPTQEMLPFNISAGIALTDFPLIRSAFALLKLQPIVLLKQFSNILLAPHLAGAEQEMHVRAQLDVYLHQRNTRQLLLQQILVEATKQHCPLLAQLLKTFLGNKSYTDQTKRTPSQWAAQFTELLSVWGWPGERTLDSTEYQLYERFRTLINEFCQLDVILSEVDRQTAVEQFQQLAHATLFQPQTKHPSPIQILGVLESAGLQFDQIWIMGLHNQAWPTSPKPNAFIPLALQRQLQLPHASNERELNFCRVLTQRLLNSATHIICSYPQQLAEQHLQISALIKHLPSITLADLELSNNPARFPETIQQTGQLEFFIDEDAPPINQKEKITGGTHIFKLQAACPFRAFAELRLGAKRIEKMQLGLNARQRGDLLHQTLEILWNHINNHTTLMSYSDTALEAMVSDAIDHVLTRFMQKYPLTFKQQFTQLEKQRLSVLIQQWLSIEKQRPPFTVIAIEQSGEYQLANIPLKLRIDRIDQLADGTHLLIDYKTSLHLSQQYWLDERLDEPQLPIYCVTSTLPITGMAFAQLRHQQMQFIGLSKTDTDIKGILALDKIKAENIPKEWNTLLTTWSNDLEKLAQQFQHGYAKVDPKYQEQTCQYCDLSSLCRVKKSK